VLAPQAGLTAESLSGHLGALLADDARLAAMAAAARAQGRPDAAAALADLVETLASGRPLA
jgi:UDP-N-acetylglucosamine--N-acetylmuramyl-(pentapeptide) pyrophosphoryl-undecaprenol N-acetylglucosamine transferase